MAPDQYVPWNHNANLQVIENGVSNLRTDQKNRVTTKRRKSEVEDNVINKRHSETQQELKTIKVHSKGVMDLLQVGTNHGTLDGVLDNKTERKEQLIQELKDLKTMYDQEIIDSDEFKEMKTVLLQKLKGWY